MLSFGLRAVICQHLLPSIFDGEKRELALEVMFNTNPIAAAIRMARFDSIDNAILAGRKDGMIGFDESIKRLFKDQRISKLTAEFLKKRGIESPDIAVAGLNPHAGEQGRMGDEEERIIAPAIETLKACGLAEFSGPHVPDSVFRAASRGDHDAVIAMYHDQGLIPLKLLDFDNAVNVTLGLPKPRTSPDHGTAFDIAGKGVASPSSMIAAMKLAAELA